MDAGGCWELQRAAQSRLLYDYLPQQHGSVTGGGQCFTRCGTPSTQNSAWHIVVADQYWLTEELVK